MPNADFSLHKFDVEGLYAQTENRGQDKHWSGYKLGWELSWLILYLHSSGDIVISSFFDFQNYLLMRHKNKINKPFIHWSNTLNLN